MPTTVHFGNGRTLQLEGASLNGTSSDLSDDATLASGQPSDIANACAAAIGNPLTLPPLASCLAPGDHVALAIAEGVPCVEKVVAGVLQGLTQAGVDAERVVIVCAMNADAEHLSAFLKQSAPEIVAHDPRDDQQLCFAGVTRADREIMLNRRLVEADVAIPIGCARAISEQRLESVFAGLFPAFSSAAVQTEQWSRAMPRVGGDGRFATTADEAGWLLGSALVMQVVPSLTSGIAGVYAGPVEAVREAASIASEAFWRQVPQDEAELVIATLTGDAREQTWENLSRTLAAAERHAASDAAIVLCTELCEPLDERLAEVLTDDDAERAGQFLSQLDLPGAPIAAHLLAARERGPLYLMSQLSPEWVEDIGLAPVANERELGRLASQRPHAVLLEGAQYRAIDTPVQTPSETLNEEY